MFSAALATKPMLRMVCVNLVAVIVISFYAWMGVGADWIRNADKICLEENNASYNMV